MDVFITVSVSKSAIALRLKSVVMTAGFVRIVVVLFSLFSMKNRVGMAPLQLFLVLNVVNLYLLEMTK